MTLHVGLQEVKINLDIPMIMVKHGRRMLLNTIRLI